MKKPILFFLLFFSFHCTWGQSFGFKIGEENKVVKIPFSIHNNFMVVDVTINGRLPLKFIFDTGAEHTILSKSIFARILGLSYDRPVKIIGADLDQQLSAYVSRNVHFRAGENAIAPHQDILVFGKDYINIDEYAGIEIHGIIGADMFRNLILKIDFKRNEIHLQSPKNYKPPRKNYSEIPMVLEKNKPYIFTQGTINDKKIELKLLMDTGASLALLLHTNTNEDIQLPENFIRGSIGRGLGGFLQGFLGRFKKLEFGEFQFDNIITNYQDVADSLDLSTIAYRDGIMGTVLLSRFNIIIDYPREKLYMQPHKKYNKGFKYDRSGLELVATGKGLNTVTVFNVIKKSPAQRAGLQNGDQILTINYLPAKLLSLKGVSRRLTKKVGKKVRLKIIRGGKKLVFTFHLEDLI